MGFTCWSEGQSVEQLLQHFQSGGEVEIVDYRLLFEQGIRILWTVEKQQSDWRLYILCNLLGSGSESLFGYKSIEEIQRPTFYSCPLEFLDLAKHSPLRCEVWRNRVRAYHATKNLKAATVI